MAPRIDDAKPIAYHEAGHAVVTLALSDILCDVAIEPPLTSCLHRRSTPATRAIIALAGHLAEQRACPSDLDCGTVGDDFLAAWAVAERLQPSAPAEQFTSFLDRAQALLDVHWDAVEAVAGALLTHKRLTGGQVAAVIARRGRPCVISASRC